MALVVGLIGVVVTGIVGIGVVVVIGWRTRSPLLFRPLIRLQRAVINPRQLQTAGTPGAYASIIRHVGRTSGRLYETPIGAVATQGGFVIGLMYGPGSSWLRNVLASGSATLVHEGQTYTVDRPEVVPLPAVAAQFGPGDRRTFRLLGVDLALRLHLAEPTVAAAGVA